MEPKVVVRESFERPNCFEAVVERRRVGCNEYYSDHIAYGNTENEALENLIDSLNTEIFMLEMDLALVKDKLLDA